MHAALILVLIVITVKVVVVDIVFVGSDGEDMEILASHVVEVARRLHEAGMAEYECIARER